MAEQKNRTALWVAGGVVLALLAGSGVTWLILGSKVKTLERQVSELESSATSAETDEAEGTNEETPTASAEAPAGADGSDPAGEESPEVTEVQPGLVQSLADDGGTWKLSIDYVQFLTGGAAADAATAHGDESPPPNDFYVVNDNPKIREFPVQAGIGVVVVTNDDGTSDPGGHALSLSQWASALSGPNGAVFRSSIYWVTVTDGTITAIRAQYTP